MDSTTWTLPTQVAVVAEDQVIVSLYEAFQELTDPRRDQGKRYQLALILSLLVLAKLAGQPTLSAAAGPSTRDCYEVGTGIVLWHCNVGEKEHEISALKPLLTPQFVKGRVLTLDAMHTRASIVCAPPSMAGGLSAGGQRQPTHLAGRHRRSV